MSETTTATPLTATPLAGGCHCGAVRFEASLDLGRAVTCNCSICTRKGLVLAFTGEEGFHLLSGDDRLREYRFNRHVIGHMFCTECGTEPFARGTRPDGAEMVAVNLRCLDGIDLAALSPQPFDGRSV